MTALSRLDAAYLAALAIVTLAGLALPRRRRDGWGWCAGLSVVLAGGLAALLLTGAGSFAFLRLLCHLVFLALPVYLLASAAILRSRASAALGLVVLAVAGDAFLVEPRWLAITRHRIESPKLDRPVRVAVLSDLQTDDIGAYERRVFESTKALRPDLVLFPGDFIHERDPARHAAQAARLRRLLQEVRLAPALGAFAVDGDVERGEDWRPIFDGTGIRTLTGAGILDLGPVELVGLSLVESRRGVTLPPATGKLRIAFGHAPDFALRPVAADLLLAGHTHGGQVQVPFVGPLLTFSSVPRRWAAGGLVALPDGRHLIVSRGIGMERDEAPRLRFNCRPEIVVVDLVPPVSAVRTLPPLC